MRCEDIGGDEAQVGKATKKARSRCEIRHQEGNWSCETPTKAASMWKTAVSTREVQSRSPEIESSLSSSKACHEGLKAESTVAF